MRWQSPPGDDLARTLVDLAGAYPAASVPLCMAAVYALTCWLASRLG